MDTNGAFDNRQVSVSWRVAMQADALTEAMTQHRAEATSALIGRAHAPPQRPEQLERGLASVNAAVRVCMQLLYAVLVPRSWRNPLITLDNPDRHLYLSHRRKLDLALARPIAPVLAFCVWP
jgi:hypothetical protein